MADYIKIYGLQRSGTNYLKALLEHNFDVRVLQNIGGWKHGKVGTPTDWSQVDTDLNEEEIRRIEGAMATIPKIFIRKELQPWLVSVKKFLSPRSGVMTDDELVAHYEEMNAHWARFCYEVWYADLRENLPRTLESIRAEFGLNYRYRDVPFRLKRGGDRAYSDYLTTQQFPNPPDR